MPDKLHGQTVPPKSFTVVWENDKPKVKPSHWEVGYTPAYQATEDLAIAYAMQAKMVEIDKVRNEWIALNLLAAEYIADTVERAGEMQMAEMGLTPNTELPDSYDDHQDH